jgi:hypothetical protein
MSKGSEPRCEIGKALSLSFGYLSCLASEATSSAAFFLETLFFFLLCKIFLSLTGFPARQVGVLAFREVGDSIVGKRGCI